MNVVYNTLPDAEQGAADPNGLRPHAAGPSVSGSRFPMFCCLCVHWASWLAAGWKMRSWTCRTTGKRKDQNHREEGRVEGKKGMIGRRVEKAALGLSLLNTVVAYLYCITLLQMFIA